MKIINSVLAGAALTLSLDDVRPSQPITQQQVMDIIAAKYQFSDKPRGGLARSTIPSGVPFTTIGAGVAPGMQMLVQGISTLQNGVATIGDKKIPIPRIDVGPDVGIIALQAATTEVADEVLDDLIPALEALGFRSLRELATRGYASNVIVQFQRGIEECMEIIMNMQEIVTASLQRTTGVVQQAKIAKLAFSFDPGLVPSSKGAVPEFSIERRAGHAYSDNRYFSSAPIPTAEHFAALERIGALIEGRSETKLR